ncbi:MAG: sugar phosphate isomerase/epimerase family protein [Clostridium perfringens]|nr:sugar phosphate isomerase/epimerase family protein [Clostridium perfringens]
MKIGVRGHDLGKHSLDDLGRILSEKGVSGIQLVLKKAITEFNVDKGSLNPGMAKYIRETLDRNNIDISILGSYINMAHPDEDELNELLDSFKEHIRFAKYLNCNIVGTETGAPNREYVYTPENNTEESFQTFIKSLRVVIEEAEKFGVIVGIEGVTNHIINTPKRMRRVLDTVKSDNLQVIFDPVNFIDESNYKRQDEIISESFELFGDRIVLIHAKDFIYKDGKVVRVPIGTGVFNYPLLLSLIKEKKPHIDIIIEGTTLDTLGSSREYLEKMYNSI